MTDVVLCECFARDGLQHEAEFVPTEVKRALIERFAALGFRRIEATSYSNPKVVPQFADASALLESLPRRAGVHYKATCANVRAVERALADLEAGFGVTEISLLVSASEAHSMKNLRQSRADQWDNVRRMAAAARGRFRLIGTISVAFGCPFEGAVDPDVVAGDAIRFHEAGVDHVALGDTTGMATPAAMKDLVRRLQREAPGVTLIAHLHDTRGTGLVNALAAYEAGVRYFDCSFGGVGGHPAQVHIRRRLYRQRLHRGPGQSVRVARHPHRHRARRPARGRAFLRARARPRAPRAGHPQRAQPAVLSSGKPQ